MTASLELKEKIMDERTHTQGGRQMKKRMVAGIVAASLLVPTGAFAAYSYIADTIYGSKEQVIQAGGTQQAYEELESKLQSAKQQLSEKEFTTFMTLLEKIGHYNLKIADSEGVLHPERLSAEEQKEYTQLTTSLQPFFTKLNGGTLDTDESFQEKLEKAKSVLSKEEFVQFEGLLKDMMYYTSKMTDKDGVLHPERLSDKERKNYELHQEVIQPYFDKLNKAMDETK
ncbi:protein of unknown function [Aneurinibacillus migulanus]|uniref:DUF3600 domain-containing protein n=1 Tax=Aneurinibacillus migulanus TaxID=47500 RepID=A0A1G8LQV4_ANEMI|nr:protein of unknown function [Aneurinibacillus migulanus]